MNNLYEISNNLKEIYNKLENGEGVDLETGEISEEMQNALVLSQQNLQEKAIDYGYMIKSFDDEIELYEKEIKRLTERKKQMESIQKRLKDNLSMAMLTFGIEEMKGKTIKLSFRKSETLNIDNLDVEKLDDKFKRIKVEVDKSAIKQSLKNGENVEGAFIVENYNLQIK